MFSDALNSIVGRLYLAMRREDGQTFVEYALIAAFVGVVLIAALGTFSTAISGELGKIGSDL
jgi:Flp pilus assembly pilin Flp